MDWSLVIQNFFQICIIPLFGFLTKFLIEYLSAKRQEISNKIDSSLNKEQQDLADKYLDMVFNTISNCVIATNQTYVDSLKAEGKFDENAQKIAFNKTLDAVLAILSEDVKVYLNSAFGDLTVYLTTLIESQVNLQK